MFVRLFFLIACSFWGFLPGICLAQPSKMTEYKNWIKEHLSDFEKVVDYKDSIAEKLIYHKDSVVQLIVVDEKQNGLNKHVEWFFKDGQLFFSEQIWINPKTGRREDHQKAYYVDGALSLWIKNDLNIDKYSPEFKEYSSKIAEFIVNFKGKFK